MPAWAVKQRQARKAAGLKVVSAAQRRAGMAKRGMLRGDEGSDMLGALMGDEVKPTIGQAVIAHPFQTLLIGTALFGIGAMVGIDRVIDAGLAVGHTVSDASSSVFGQARKRRAIR